MVLAPNTIQAAVGSRRKSRRLGRGHGSGRGTSAGRGTKGQRARTGGRSRTAIRAFKRSLQKVPKLRGFTSRFDRPETVTLRVLEGVCKSGDVVNPKFLLQKKLMTSFNQGVKILASGELTKKITLEGCLASKSAVAAIEKVGGSVIF